MTSIHIISLRNSRLSLSQNYLGSLVVQLLFFPYWFSFSNKMLIFFQPSNFIWNCSNILFYLFRTLNLKLIPMAIYLNNTIRSQTFPGLLTNPSYTPLIPWTWETSVCIFGKRILFFKIMCPRTNVQFIQCRFI